MNTFNLPNDEITLRAEALLVRFKKLFELTGILLPADYDPRREGGYLCLFNSSESYEQYQVGKILDVSDPDYRTKAEKYKAFSFGKCLAIFNEPDTLVSSQTQFKVAGGLRLNNGIIGFSGRTPHEDEALIAILAYQSSWMSYQELLDLQKKINNPYLEGKILDFLLLTVPKQGIYFA